MHLNKRNEEVEMDTMKKFLMWALIIIGVFIFSEFLMGIVR